ncbi:MAG: hypothetical protein D6728_02225 [Cyanobacteria bacterium J055]|nr:MAG: hypothetical protein D6728_02225 [Cyanobacteria bacterium J055]
MVWRCLFFQFPRIAIAVASLPMTLLAGTSAIAQVSQPPLQRQGTEVYLNDRREFVPWRQWQDATGWRIQIGDTGLRSIAGFDLLSTSDPTRQPVEWFSDFPTEPIVLPAQFDGKYRYLDVSELARRLGWQMEVRENTLYIKSEATQVRAIRQGEQPWGQRIVFELSGNAPWHMDRQDDRWLVSFDSTIFKDIVKRLPPSKLWTIEASAQGVRLFLNLPVSQTPRVYTLSNPDRLVIDIGADPIAERDILWMPGIRWRQQMVEVRESRFPVVWLEVDRHRSELEFQPIWTNPDSQVGIAPLQETASAWGAIAAINAGFFNRNTELSLGAIRSDDRWYSSPILHRGAIGWDEAGNFEIDRLTLQEELITAEGQHIGLGYLNSGYAQGGASRYTPEWGETYMPLSDNEILVAVEGDRATQHIKGGLAGETPVPIPADGYLLALRDAPDLANSFPIGTQLAIAQTTEPASFDRYSQILAAGPLLVQNSQIVLDALAERFNPYFAKGRASRSAIGTTKTGQFLLVILRPDATGRGATLWETAEVMRQLGAVDALNLDGGSSASLYLGGQLVDRVPATAARVHNGLGIFFRSSTNP